MTWADGSQPIATWKPVDADAGREVETVDGLVLDRLWYLPWVGQRPDVLGWPIAVIDLDGLRIDKRLTSRVA